MTSTNRIRVQTLNQPSSRFAFEIDLTAAKLSELLGWDPGGEAVAAVLADLEAGRNRIVRTAQVPRDKGTDCVEFHLSPIGGFAAIASNGLEPVVWGIGTTEDAARQEAEEWGGEDAPGDYVFVPITAAQRELIKAGDVSAASLGIELTKGQIAELA